MAATITWNGYGRVTNADATTGWAALKISGTGGGPTAAAADGSIEGTGAVTCVTSKQRVAIYFDLGSGLDFTTTYAGQMVYLWANFLAPSLLLARASGGFGILLETLAPSASQYNLWYMDGNDTYFGGWKRFVLDPTKTISASAGTAFNPASVRYFGLFADVGAATLRFDNLICDAIDVGTGLTVTGTSTTDALVADLLADEATTRYGIVSALNSSGTASRLNGSLVLGTTVAATASTLTDINAKLFLSTPTYYQASVKPSVPLDYFGITVVGGTGTNSIIIGKAVGADSGRNGWTIVGNPTYRMSMDFDNGSVNTSEWYGCNFEDITGPITWGTNTAHKLFSANFTGCQQFDPVGGVQIRNCNFATLFDDGTADASLNAALLWNANIDIENCNFLANSHASSDVAHGIEHDAITSVYVGTATSTGTTVLTDTGATFTGGNVNAGEYIFNETDGSYAKIISVDDATHVTHETLAGGAANDWSVSDAYSISPAVSYTNLVFSGNEKDVLNSASGSDGLFISKAGSSNPASFTNNVVAVGAVTIKCTVVNKANTPIQTAQTSIHLTDGTELLNSDTNASGVVSSTFTGATPANVIIRVRKASTGSTKYQNFSTTGTIQSGTGLDVTVVLTVDTINAS